MVLARCVAVSKLGACLVVASYKENPSIELIDIQSGDWREYREELAKRRKKDNKKPSRWHAKVLVCTDTKATARQVVQWYELRWQIEIFFRELKSRMQLGCYVLMKFETVERYLNLLMMGFLLLETQRLSDRESTAALPWFGFQDRGFLPNTNVELLHAILPCQWSHPILMVRNQIEEQVVDWPVGAKIYFSKGLPSCLDSSCILATNR